MVGVGVGVAVAADEQQILLLEHTLLQKEDNTSGTYTGDGSVDLHGRPVLKAQTGNWRACLFILCAQCCDRLAFSGIDGNLVNYLTGRMHQGNISAARIVSTWSGTCFLTPILGAFIADAYLGRYWTVAVSSTAYFIGMCILILSASIPALQLAECVDSGCPPASRGQYALFFAGLYLMALGAGGIKPCVPSFGADQFDDTDPVERVKKGSFFNWLLFSISIGSLLASTLIVWIQENVGWSVGFTIPALFMGIGLASFFSGTRFYRFQKLRGSPFTLIYRDVVALARKVKLDVPNDSDGLYGTPEKNLAIERRLKEHHDHDDGLKFQDLVAVSSDAQMNAGPHTSFTTSKGKELKILLRMIPIWITGIVYCASYAQTSTTFVEQGMVMNRSIASFRVPAASLSLFVMIVVLFWVPFDEKVLLPLIKKFTVLENGVSELQRFGIGLFLSVPPMLCAAFVEMRRLKLVTEVGIAGENVDAPPLSICWQIPQYLLIGISDAIAFAGRFGFFYDQSPENMKSLGMALVLLNTSMGDYLSSLVLSIVSIVTTSGGSAGWIPDDLNKGQLHKYFMLWACLGFLNFLVFVFFAMRYKDRRSL